MKDSTPEAARSGRIREVHRAGSPGYWTHPQWETALSWLVQGITGPAPSEDAPGLDFALFTERPAPEARESWEALGGRLGFGAIAHSRQIHGSGILRHGGETPDHGGKTPAGGRTIEEGVPHRLLPGNDADGHITASKGLLLGVTVADCVPVFVVDSRERAVALLHAGWRGAAEGIVERGIDLLQKEYKSRPQNLHVHLGPAICGRCYEVGPEVHRALGLPDPGKPTPVDLRAHLAFRARALGVPGDQVTESAWCTLCGESPFYSHRGGDGGRQVGFLGIRDSIQAGTPSQASDR